MELLDASEVDIEQCRMLTSEVLNLEEVGLVICSPLRRCLSTAKGISEGKTGLKVVVEPMLCGRIAAAWSVCSPLAVLEQEFPCFDFSELKQLPENWMLNLLTSEDKQLSKEIPVTDKSMQENMLGLLKKGYYETYNSFFQRTRDLKKRICKLLSQHVSPESKRRKILIISHSCVLSFLLGSEMNPWGKVRDKISFEHCRPRSFSSQEVLRVQPGL